jgi:hypothetical protein
MFEIEKECPGRMQRGKEEREPAKNTKIKKEVNTGRCTFECSLDQSTSIQKYYQQSAPKGLLV